MDINVQLASHEVVGNKWGTKDVRVRILDGHDEAHAVVIDRPGAAIALMEAAQAFLEANS